MKLRSSRRKEALTFLFRMSLFTLAATNEMNDLRSHQ